MRASRDSPVLPATAAVLGTGLVAAGALHAVRAAAAGRTVLAFLAGPLDAAIRAGGALADAAAAVPAALLGTALATVAVWLGLSLLRARQGASRLVAAGLLAGLAEWLLVDGLTALGLAGGAAACAGFWARREAAAGDGPAPRPASVALAAALVLFACAALYRLDVYPLLYFDEVAYLRAARMQLGEMEPGTIVPRWGGGVYVFEQFRLQRLPLWLHAVAVRALGADVLALRLASFGALALALVLAAITLGRRAGARATSAMVLLAAVAPLFVAYARTGFYLAVSVLHGVLVLAALLRFGERRDAISALGLGLVAGLSLYGYQLSWFAPLLALLALGVAPTVWRAPGAAPRLLAAGVLALAVALPGLVGMREGLAAVADQTFDRALWNADRAPRGEVAVLLAPAAVSDAVLATVAAELREAGVRAVVQGGEAGRRSVALAGEASLVADAVRDAEARRWGVLRDARNRGGLAARLGAMLGQLFAAPGWESSGRYVDAPLVNPLLAPLLWLGFGEAFRRGRAPAWRMLAVWVAGACVLPAVVGAAAPRRALLALPWAYALAALPLLELRARLASAASRRVLAAACAAFGVAVACTGLHTYFERWERRPGATRYDFHLLELVKLLKRRPADEGVLVVDVIPRTRDYLEGEEGLGREGPTVVSRDETPDEVRRRWCRTPRPFTLATADQPGERERLAPALRAFDTRSEVQGAFLLVRVIAPGPGACGPGQT